MKSNTAFDGMTRRDYFAAKAMQAILVNAVRNQFEFNQKQRIAQESAHMADAMIAELDAVDVEEVKSTNEPDDGDEWINNPGFGVPDDVKGRANGTIVIRYRDLTEKIAFLSSFYTEDYMWYVRNDNSDIIAYRRLSRGEVKERG